MITSSNRHNAPTALTIADRNRQTIALREGEKRRRRALALGRLARLAVCCIAIALAVGLFYAGTA